VQLLAQDKVLRAKNSGRFVWRQLESLGDCRADQVIE
jgi:hypothetical protein